MSKMDWRRARRAQQTTDRYFSPDRLAPRLTAKREPRATKAQPVIPVASGGGYYRAVGSVQSISGVWQALDGAGTVVGEYATRSSAWQHADQFGLEFVPVAAAVISAPELSLELFQPRV